MRIAVTGTPGVGKSTLARLAAERYGWILTDVRTLAQAHGLIAGHDEEDDAEVIDVEALVEVLEASPAALDAERTEVLDGHLSHFLPVDRVWVVRCDPHILEERLRGRGYHEQKVRENLEAEAMDLVLQEAVAGDAPVVQRDGTRRSPEELLTAFVDRESDPLNTPEIEPVDWSDWLLE